MERCLDDLLSLKPATEVWKVMRNGTKQGKRKQNVLTLENDGTVWVPGISKTSRVLISLNVDKPRTICEDIELVRMLKVFCWLDLKFTPICLRRCWEICVEVWILR